MNPRRFPGAAVAIVTNLTDPQQQGRVKVRYPWLHDDEGAKPFQDRSAHV